MTAPVVVYDACVLFPGPLRDLLLRLAEEGVVEARWSDRILEEARRAARRHRPGLDPAELFRRAEAIEACRPACRVAVDPAAAESLRLPDPGDRHVLAAALAGGADGIVTLNLRDFPRRPLAALGLRADHPDAFLLRLAQVDLAGLESALDREATAVGGAEALWAGLERSAVPGLSAWARGRAGGA